MDQSYIVRFEILDSAESDYTRLKQFVEKAGFSKIIVSKEGTRYLLPHGMYQVKTPRDIDHVHSVAASAVNAVKRIIKKQIRILIITAGSCSFSDLARA